MRLSRRTGGCAARSPVANAQARPQPKPVARTVATVSAPALPAAPAAKPVKAGKTPSADEGDWEQF
jgi:methyl-accepting chemotaxis protein